MLRTFVVASVFLSPAALMGMGNSSVSGATVSKTMAGAGVATFGDEFDAILENPAMMTYSPTAVGTHKAALVLDAHFVNLQAAPLPDGNNYHQSKGKGYYLPFFGYFYNASERVKFGTGLYQIAGAASDFTGTASLQNAKNSFNFLAVPFSASYQLNETSSFGVSLDLISASISLNNYGKNQQDQTRYSFSPAVGYVHNFGDGHLVGAHYLRGTNVTFTKVADIQGNGTLEDIRVGTPDEISVGYGRDLGNFSYTSEYKYVTWANAANFKDLGWKNQNIAVLAGQYKTTPYLTLRGGVTYASQTVPTQTNVNGDALVTYQGKQVPTYFVQSINASSGISQSAVSAGIGYNATPALTLNTGVLYFLAKQVEQTGTSTALGGAYKTGGKLQKTEVVFMASYQFNPT